MIEFVIDLFEIKEFDYSLHINDQIKHWNAWFRILIISSLFINWITKPLLSRCLIIYLTDKWRQIGYIRI